MDFWGSIFSPGPRCGSSGSSGSSGPIRDIPWGFSIGSATKFRTTLRTDKVRAAVRRFDVSLEFLDFPAPILGGFTIELRHRTVKFFFWTTSTSKSADFFGLPVFSMLTERAVITSKDFFRIVMMRSLGAPNDLQVPYRSKFGRRHGPLSSMIHKEKRWFSTANWFFMIFQLLNDLWGNQDLNPIHTVAEPVYWMFPYWMFAGWWTAMSLNSRHSLTTPCEDWSRRSQIRSKSLHTSSACSWIHRSSGWGRVEPAAGTRGRVENLAGDFFRNG